MCTIELVFCSASKLQPLEFMSFLLTALSKSIQVSCQSFGIDSSRNVVLLLSFHICDEVQWFYTSRSFQPAKKCQAL